MSIRRDNNGEVDPERTWGDQPIRRIKEDGFDYRQYVDVLKDRVLHTETPATIGIFGSWGSGKSSLMEMVRESIVGNGDDEDELTRRERMKRRIKHFKLRLTELISKWFKHPRSSLTELVSKTKEWFKAKLNRSETEKKVRIEAIWINVWELGTQEEVWHAFLQAIFSEVYKNIPWWRNINWRKLGDQAIRNSWRVIVVAVPALAAVYLSKSGTAKWDDVLQIITLRSESKRGILGGVVTQIVALVALYKPAWDALRKSLKFDVSAVLKTGSYQAQISELMKLRKRFEDVVKLAVGKEGRIVVFIDDLDRCTPDTVPEVLEAIKLFASTANCVYVLAFDQKIVAGRIAKKYGFDEPEESISYLEKIVQIPFQLPPLDDADIERFIEEHYPDLEWGIAQIFAKGLEANPRSIKRAINTLRILQAMAEKRVAAWVIDPLTPRLMAKTVVLQTRFKQLYSRLVEKPEFLLEVEKWAEPPDQAEEVNDPAAENSAAVHEVPLVETAEGKAKTGEKLGAPSADPVEEQINKLVDAKSQIALKAVLTEGPRFNDKEERDHVHWYIYLGGDTTGAEDQSHPGRKYRDGLLSNKRSEIEKTFKEIFPRDRLQYDWEHALFEAYRQRLRRVLGDARRYEIQSQRLSATLALDVLEKRTSEEGTPCNLRKPGEEGYPCTVRVPGRKYMGGWGEWDARIAKAWGIEYTPRDEGESAGNYTYAYPRDFRIGRYPVQNAEFSKFIEWTKGRGDLRSALKPGVVECEAYWPTCKPKPAQPKDEWPEAWGVPTPPESFYMTRLQLVGSAPRTCAFLRPDESELVEVKLSVTREARYDAEFRLDIQLIEKQSSGEMTSDRIEMALPGMSRIQRQAGGKYSFTEPNQRSRLGIDSDALCLRVRVIDDSGEEVKHVHRQGLDGFWVEVSVWDKKAVPELNFSFPSGKEPNSEKGWVAPVNSMDHPVTNVTWDDALLYCLWLRTTTGFPFRLPTEIEWELAASGHHHLFPWGNYWNAKAANIGTQTKGTTAVGKHSVGDSPYCCADMAGNVWEWCADRFNKTIGQTSGNAWHDIRLHGEPHSKDKIERSVRGGSWGEDKSKALCCYRDCREPGHRSQAQGFRVVVSSDWE